MGRRQRAMGKRKREEVEWGEREVERVRETAEAGGGVIEFEAVWALMGAERLGMRAMVGDGERGAQAVRMGMGGMEVGRLERGESSLASTKTCAAQWQDKPRAWTDEWD